MFHVEWSLFCFTEVMGKTLTNNLLSDGATATAADVSIGVPVAIQRRTHAR